MFVRSPRASTMIRHVLSETSQESRSIITGSTVRRSLNARNAISVTLLNLIAKPTLRFVVPKSIDVFVIPNSLGN